MPAKFWRLTGWTNIAPRNFKLTLRCIAFRIYKACYRRKSTVSPGKLILPKKKPLKRPFWGDKNELLWVWEELEAKPFTTGRLLGYPWKLMDITLKMWKVGGLKIVTAASWRIILPGWHRNWWKSAFFYKTLRTRKFSRGNFFEGSTHGILTHSRFRICVLKGLATHFWPCYSCPKSGEGGKTRFASKNKEA